MNSIVSELGHMLEQTQALRNQLMEILSDGDLGYSPGGENLTLGALCREMGEVQQAYICRSARRPTPHLPGGPADLLRQGQCLSEGPGQDPARAMVILDRLRARGTWTSRIC